MAVIYKTLNAEDNSSLTLKKERRIDWMEEYQVSYKILPLTRE